MTWQNKIQVQKGDYGEDIVQRYLESRGFIVYKPDTNGKHGFDRLAVRDKKEMVIAEIKSKARMKKYRATGIDIRHYEEYKFIQSKHKIPVFLFFVDEWIGKIYGNWLYELEKESIDDTNYPNTDIKPGIIFFSYVKMKQIHDLTSEQIAFLKNHSSRNYDYY